MAKISIITVTFNNIRGLLSTIKSVFEQTFDDKEYIVIDGGSNDGSVDVIKQNAPNITKWISEPDHGIYDAMNKGINLANGDWIIFMNSGDSFNNERILENIFNNRSYDNTDVIYGNTLYKRSKEVLIAPDKITKSFFFSNTLCHQSIFTNRKAFDRIGNYSMKFTYISDREWLLSAKIAELNFLYVNETISIWDNEGSCKNNSQLVLKEINQMRKFHFNIFEIPAFYLLDKASNFLKQLSH